jgi:hypothetical protein
MERIVSRKIIIVEGRDDNRFIESLLNFLNIFGVQVIEVGGKSNFRPQIIALKNTPGFSQIEICAFIRDADDDPPSAFRSLFDSLSYAGLIPPSEDQTFSSGNPRIGIFIMPGNGENGAIENLCIDSVRDENSFECVDRYFECIGTLETVSPKAKLLCYLSGKETYCNSLGYAALKGHWDFNKEPFTKIKEFIKSFQ